MTRNRVFLVFTAAALLLLPSVGSAAGFEFNGLRLGMSVAELINGAKSGRWTIASYTTVDGRSQTRRVDYPDLPSLDSLTDQVIVEINNFRMGGKDAADTTSPEIAPAKLYYRFGTVRRIELNCPIAYPAVMKNFAVASIGVFNKILGPADKSTTDVEKFFGNYDPSGFPTGQLVNVAKWPASGGPLPIEARMDAVRACLKEDCHDDANGINWPRGVVRLTISQTPAGMEEQWVALRKSLQKSRTAVAPARNSKN